jgi:hypothetical protein
MKALMAGSDFDLDEGRKEFSARENHLLKASYKQKL